MEIYKRDAVISPIILSVIGMSGFLILPLIIGAAANSLHFDEQQLGWMASIIMFAAALSSIFAIVWIRKINWQLAGYVALSVMCFSYVAAFFIHHQIFFVLLIALAAFGGGTLYSIALTVLSDSKHTDRNFGFSIAAQVSFQVLSLMILPMFIQQHGINSLIVLFLILVIVGLTLVRWIPIGGVKSIKNEPSKNNVTDVKHVLSAILTPKIIFALLGCFMFFMNVGVIWTYIERMGNNEGFSAENIGLALSIGVFFGIPGALLASWVGERFDCIRSLALGAIVTVISVYMLLESMTFVDYIIALALYNLAWNFSLTFQYAVVNKVDTSGVVVAAAPAFHATGAAAGPVIAVLYVTSSSFIAVNTIAICSVIISLLFFAIATYLDK
ncbi:MAG: MFS transporter [Paraglaciecola sp.]|uniref:MFS transporter n=1 Tax=Paraglaciecola sp. TaxID=1920173 RepID=UPI00329A5DDD